MVVVFDSKELVSAQAMIFGTEGESFPQDAVELGTGLIVCPHDRD